MNGFWILLVDRKWFGSEIKMPVQIWNLNVFNCNISRTNFFIKINANCRTLKHRVRLFKFGIRQWEIFVQE